jgi:hypothetical protein
MTKKSDTLLVAENTADEFRQSAREVAAAWCNLSNRALLAGIEIRVTFYTAPDGRLQTIEPLLSKVIR